MVGQPRSFGILFPVMVALLLPALFGIRGTFAVPPDERGDSTDGSEEYQDDFTALLSDGFQPRADLKAVERHYLGVQRLRPHDPQLEYAWGLVLLKNHQHSAAVEQFHKAVEGDPHYLPAQRAVIRELIRRQDYAEAVEQLIALSGIVGQPQGKQPSAGARIETARWMGRAAGFLAGPLGLESVREQAAAADVSIRAQLGNDYATLYDHGRQDVAAIIGQLQAEQQQAEAAAALKQQEQEAEFEARMQEYKARQKRLEETKKEQDTAALDAASELDARLEQLVDRFETLNKSARSLLESIQATQFDIQRLQFQADLRNAQREQSRRNRGIFWQDLTFPQIATRTQELNLYLTEYTNVLAQRKRTAMQARSLLAVRASTERQSRQASGAVSAEIDKVQQWDQRLKRAMQEAAQATPSSPQMRSLINRTRLLATYEEFDLDKERQRLLRTYVKAMN